MKYYKFMAEMLSKQDNVKLYKMFGQNDLIMSQFRESNMNNIELQSLLPFTKLVEIYYSYEI